MSKSVNNHIKLGTFVLAGLGFLIVMLYMIGKNQYIFSSTFVLKARFRNVQGLVTGNNVRFAGIEAGTIKDIQLVNDSLVEVTMVIHNSMKHFIRKNALASIGSDGLMGNKVINITAVNTPATPVAESDLLPSRTAVDTDDMLHTLYQTNQDVAVIASQLRTTVIRFNQSQGFWDLLQDQRLPRSLLTSASHIQETTERAAAMAADLQQVIRDVQEGKGALGKVLRDSALSTQLLETIGHIQMAGKQLNTLTGSVQSSVSGIEHELQNGHGTLHALLKDSALVVRLQNSLYNIEQGTAAFGENMEALKHNFLLRGYFRKLERQKQHVVPPPMANRDNGSSEE